MYQTLALSLLTLLHRRGGSCLFSIAVLCKKYKKPSLTFYCAPPESKLQERLFAFIDRYIKKNTCVFCSSIYISSFFAHELNTNIVMMRFTRSACRYFYLPNKTWSQLGFLRDFVKLIFSTTLRLAKENDFSSWQNVIHLLILRLYFCFSIFWSNMVRWFLCGCIFS